MKAKKRTKKPIIITITVIAVCIVIAIVGVVFITANKKQEIAQTNNTTESVDEEGKYVEVSDDGTKTNVSAKLNEDKKFDDLEISNISLKGEGQLTQLTATVTNNTNKTKGGYPATIIFVDSNNNKIEEMGTYIKELEAGETTTLNASITFDYTNAYDIIIEK